jgi:hypothetical protein
MAMSILKRCVIAVTGDFGKDRTHSKIRKWVEANGGVFALQVSHEVTHLVCSTEHFKRNAPMGEYAKHDQLCWRVTYAWWNSAASKETEGRLRRDLRLVGGLLAQEGAQTCPTVPSSYASQDQGEGKGGQEGTENSTFPAVW